MRVRRAHTQAWSQFVLQRERVVPMAPACPKAIDVVGVVSNARHDGPEARVAGRPQLVQLGPQVTVGIGPCPRVRRRNQSHGAEQPRRRRNFLVDVSAGRELQRCLGVAEQIP